MERHCKKCGFFATNASDADDATCPRCAAAYPKTEPAAAGRTSTRLGGGVYTGGTLGAGPNGPRASEPSGRGAGPDNGDAQWARMRRAAPVNVALPRTLEWSHRLPADVQPRELLRTFGRIANRLAADWEETERTYAYFDELLIDRRGNRRGFPPAVKAELEALHRSYAVNRPARGSPIYPGSHGVWDDVRKR